MPLQIRELFIDADEQAEQEQEVFESVLQLMPALQRFQTRELIADFLSSPGAFLEGIDLYALVKTLLRRAAELPARVVEELKLLQEKLVSWSGEYLSLYELGTRALTIITLVVVLG